ncbi:hypothetical protein DM02DRAFT_717011 [Periconia macrospinosa]|uniref:Prion-inhibition and propagation HeLo domain-containing protein n=1 Tax=Periconia macrospinosa TaxID=97972 RepID=A0A2V1E0B6_9PLEO|nr:hypothetical protein DM02DRAFT_717011 [Periconia macrospinosa]
MSGIEVAGLVFGVLPILMKAVKSYSAVSQTFHDFRHYSKEVKLIHIQFRVHHGIFMNECKLFLCLIEDENGAKIMLEDNEDRRWISKDLNDRFNEVLKENIELFRSIIEAAKEVIDSIEEDLERFDVIVEQKSQSESIRATIKRLRNATKISLDKSKYEKSLSSLRNWNSELSQLRGHISAFQQNRSSTNKCKGYSSLPSHIKSIRMASQNLHEALSSAWCCGDLTHNGHYAKLYVEAEVESEVRLDLAISYNQETPRCSSANAAEPPILLYVQTISMDTASNHTITSEATSSTTHKLKKKASSDLCQETVFKRKKKKRVHFSDSSTTHCSSGPSISHVVATASSLTQPSPQPSLSQMNLCQTKNICHYLMQNLQVCNQPSNSRCLGYLDSPEMYRHIFYLQEKNKLPSPNKKNVSASAASDESFILSIYQAMMQESDDGLCIVNQLKLAHKATLAILQFNNTPWLHERWSLKDLSYFGTRKLFNEDSLKTLHLSSHIAPTAKLDSFGLMEGVECATAAGKADAVPIATEDEIYGINNATLFCLGVALLEIAHWKPIEHHNLTRDANPIITARRLAARPSLLGPRYQDIARKCLQCNFGFGTDLEKKELQEAVHRDVICQLEQMIELLSL